MGVAGVEPGAAVRSRRFPGRDASLMQIAAAVVGSAAAAQVIQAGARDEEMETQMDQHTYLTQAEPGVTEAADQLDVVGANRRRLIARWTKEGVYVGGCLIADRADAEYLAAFLTREADE